MQATNLQLLQRMSLVAVDIDCVSKKSSIAPLLPLVVLLRQYACHWLSD